jgi:hypothetical protein
MQKIKDFFKGMKEGQKKFGDNISVIVNTILLSIVYFLGVGLTSIVARLFGVKFLETKTNPEVKTYYETMENQDKKEESYYRQF